MQSAEQEERQMENDKRPTYDEYFMNMARLVSTRSTCLRRKVGAVIVKEDRIISTGYNGAPRGLKHCLEIGCLRDQLKIPSGERHELCRGVHAEQNALAHAAMFGVSIKNATIYITHNSCIICTKLLINAGIKEIVYAESYFDELSKKFLEESAISVKKISIK
jgi:dCMP deaminase